MHLHIKAYGKNFAVSRQMRFRSQFEIAPGWRALVLRLEGGFYDSQRQDRAARDSA
jgi:hypothetical protein